MQHSFGKAVDISYGGIEIILVQNFAESVFVRLGTGGEAVYGAGSEVRG